MKVSNNQIPERILDEMQHRIPIGYFKYETNLSIINIKISDTYMQTGRIAVNRSVNLLPL